MLFPVISILLLTAQCVAQTNDTFVKASISRLDMRRAILGQLNDARISVTETANAANLYELTWDGSLEWLARKSTNSCENPEDLEGLKQIRFRVTQGPKGDKLIVSDILDHLKDFNEYIDENGPEFDSSMPEFTKKYEFFRHEWRRIGCAFKICNDEFTGEETNLVCIFGPKPEQPLTEEIFEVKSKEDRCTDCKCNNGVCKEDAFSMDHLSDEQFQEKVLAEFNGARSEFSQVARVSSMSKLVWDATLAQSASDAGNACPGNLTHSANYRQWKGDKYLDYAAGLSVIGEMYGMAASEELSSQVYERSPMYTVLWGGMTKVGCAKTPSCNQKVFCHFGDVGQLTGQMFEQGDACSKCENGCVDGLCADAETTTAVATTEAEAEGSSETGSSNTDAPATTAAATPASPQSPAPENLSSETPALVVPETSSETTPEPSPALSPETSPETTSEASPETSTEPSPETSTETTPEASPETSPEASPETSTETSTEPSPIPEAE